MTINTPNSKTFRLERSGLKLAELRYPSYWSQKAEARFSHGQLRIKCNGGWGSRYRYELNGQERGRSKLGSWRNNATIEVDWLGDGETTEYRLKKRGWSLKKFSLQDVDGRELFRVKACFSWRKFRYTFEVDGLHSAADEQVQELVIYALHTIRVLIWHQSAAAA